MVTASVISLNLLVNGSEILQTVSSSMIVVTLSLVILYPILAVAEWVISSALEYIF